MPLLLDCCCCWTLVVMRSWLLLLLLFCGVGAALASGDGMMMPTAVSEDVFGASPRLPLFTLVAEVVAVVGPGLAPFMLLLSLEELPLRGVAASKSPTPVVPGYSLLHSTRPTNPPKSVPTTRSMGFLGVRRFARRSLHPRAKNGSSFCRMGSMMAPETNFTPPTPVSPITKRSAKYPHDIGAPSIRPDSIRTPRMAPTSTARNRTESRKHGHGSGGVACSTTSTCANMVTMYGVKGCVDVIAQSTTDSKTAIHATIMITAHAAPVTRSPKKCMPRYILPTATLTTYAVASSAAKKIVMAPTSSRATHITR
eukprot:PhM_4_TR6300/c0_g1_i1/m.3190